MDKDIQREIRKIIDRIEKKSAGGDYIYRGEPKRHRKISSTLYRKYAKEIEAENFDIEVVQAEMVPEAKRYIYEKDDFEILTQLQHYGGKTNLIDFTTDYLIALFFACDGFPNSGSRVILLEKSEAIKDYIKEPQSPINRVRDQRSIFIQPPKGFIERGQYNAINIPKWLKQPMLDHLEKYHGISANVIYNDLHGFIRVQDLHQSEYAEFFKGLTCQNKGNKAKNREEKQKWYKEAVKHYTEALKLNSQLFTIYNNRGVAHRDLGDYEQAIDDYDCAIELNPDHADAHNNRGVAYHNTGEVKHAIDDYDRAIELNPDHVNAYNNRGNARSDLGDYKCAIDDYNKAIQLKPDLAEAYYNRGNTHRDLGDYKRAIDDYDRAIVFNPDYVDVYVNRGNAHLHLRDYKRAIDDYNRAMALNPDDADAYNNRNAAQRELERLNKSL